MKHPVIAIGLDAADPSIIEGWMAQGHLKTLSRLRDQGAYTRLETFSHYRAETPWTTFLTGCSPKNTGYWSPVKYDEATYGVTDIGAYDFSEYLPFYALGSDYRVAVFDMPQSKLSEQANGPQVLAWGAHSALTPSESLPAHLFQELVTQHGEHPVFNKDHADTRNLPALIELKDHLVTGIHRRAKICQDLLQREPWDLFLTVFGETHSAGHFFWHLSQPEHPLYEVMGKAAPDLMLETFVEIDRAIGDILSKAPENATVLVFAAHGMGSNVMDLPSMFFLPELMYRFNFGKPGFAPGKLGAPLPPPKTSFKKRGWLGEVWSLKADSNPVRSFLRQNAPTKVFERLEPLFGASPETDLLAPHTLMAEGDELYFQPARWYQPFWPQMKAFALPSYSEGYIRINLKGREPQGIVEPAEYDALCDELTQLLYNLKDARTGQPMVRGVTRTREHASDRDPKLPDADLVVLWQEDHAADTVDSPELGRVGPVPYLRTGSHRSRGFFLAHGPKVTPGTLPPGHSLDLAPTILTLLESPIPSYIEGKSLLEVAPKVAV
ncbi:alkaline phosphatase family protein [Leptolyngbya sp. FACHB-36]|uniref:alkaline phosphatase family protein n=1 Tax=Leptolyngbya sp. FACHB-36 TaxID=2692808 RepID=UPI0016815258|nr:alkaline phosphatase family protein [Leptolyngbya sp. FACHB-36]MBD2022192.1 alkaline phosphatase family protein [Leptolyngbya sp. FACHB-36]